MSTAIHSNSDNAGLMPVPAGNLVIGYVDEVNGKGAEEILSFSPTRHELVVLVKYWMKRILDIDFFWLIFACTGSSEIRSQAFADRRIEAIRAIVGTEEVDKALEEAREQFKKEHDINDEVWRIFTKGTPAEVETFQLEMARERGEEVSESHLVEPVTEPHGDTK